MNKLAVFTLKIVVAEPNESEDEILEALMALFEAFGYEPIGELSYEDCKDEDEDGEAYG